MTRPYAMSTLAAVLGVVLAVAPGCKTRRKIGGAKDEHAKRPALPWVPAAIAHGGVGSAPDKVGGCRRAVDAALAVLDAGGDPADAAVAGVVVLEDDPAYNAGLGSRVRIDGDTVQMDASVMRSDGRFGAVAVIEDVQNPVKVARAVMDTPHTLLAGDGATRFARTLGLPEVDLATPEMKAAADKIRQQLRAADPSLPADWRNFDWRKHWNFERTLEQAGLSEDAVGHDTVGVAVRTRDGRFAVALSTGGTSVTMRGRVGDVPQLGAGLYAGPWGAAAATGKGERIVDANLSRWAHSHLRSGWSAKKTAEHAVKKIADLSEVGIIVIDAKDMTAAASQPMAWAARTSGSTTWLGPAPPP